MNFGEYDVDEWTSIIEKVRIDQEGEEAKKPSHLAFALMLRFGSICRHLAYPSEDKKDATDKPEDAEPTGNCAYDDPC